MDAPAMVGKKNDVNGREPLHLIRDGTEWDLLPKERHLESKWPVRNRTLPGSLSEQSGGIPSHLTFLADKSSNPHAFLPPFFFLSCCSFFLFIKSSFSTKLKAAQQYFLLY